MKKPKTLSPRDQASMGPRQLKDPSSAAFAWQTISLLKTRYQSKATSEKNWTQTLEEAEQYRVYERVPEEKPYGSLDAMLLAEIGVTADESKKDVSNRQQAAQQAARENTEAALNVGANQHTTEDRTKTETVLSSDGSNSKTRRIRRLRRDHPEAAERLEAGEFKSVAAAERWARGEEPHPAYPKKTSMMWLEHWWNKADDDTKQEFLDKNGLQWQRKK